jgi:hypothetical protein
VAIAVALAVLPRASAVGGVYGIVMVAAAGTLATRLGGRAERPTTQAGERSPQR